jgi:hypothetical protein
MNSIINTLRVVILVLILYGCSSSGSKENTAPQDSLNTTTDSVAVAAPKVISQSDVSALEAKVNEQFEKIYKDIADTTNYRMVLLQDNYNEYEGQDEHWETELYYDKESALRYFKEVNRSGSGGGNIKEYIIENRTIVWGREKEMSRSDQESITLWSDQPGVIKSNTSDPRKPVNESIQDGYKTQRYNDINAHLSSISNVLNNGVTSETNDSYSAIIKEEKENDLTDSTRVIVPKALYKKLKAY